MARILLAIVSAPLGVSLAAARAPESFQAYIGGAQMSYQLSSELLPYGDMRQRCREAAELDLVRDDHPQAVTVPSLATLPLPSPGVEGGRPDEA